jgi:hypothetical protein
MTHHLNKLVQSGQEKGFKVEQNVDYGAGPIDVVWNINLHSALPNIKCGFVTLGAEEEEGSRYRRQPAIAKKDRRSCFSGDKKRP